LHVTSTPISSLSLRLAGWKFEGEAPRIKKYVCLAVPHTSNWDGLLLVLLARTIHLPMAWMIKDQWVRGPLGPLLKATGAIGIDRSKAHNMVQQMIDVMKAADELALVIPPEGTRGRAETWRSGFYHIAVGAGVPVVPGYLDYGRKRAGLGAPISMTGDVKADMDRIRAFYAQHAPRARRPEGFGPIKLREEGA
jgi:1-acyl-sn-glycerol-3-phosphate acyltransferase